MSAAVPTMQRPLYDAHAPAPALLTAALDEHLLWSSLPGDVQEKGTSPETIAGEAVAAIQSQHHVTENALPLARCSLLCVFIGRFMPMSEELASCLSVHASVAGAVHEFAG